jgi:predicted enzyme related to lactoylglutathione lyase
MQLVIDYIEIGVSDVAKAKEFYAAAAGWSFNDYGPDYAGVVDPRNAGEEFAGLSAGRSTGTSPLVLMRTDDADAVLASVTAAGGQVREPLEPYPGGRRFTFADPWGNVLGVYEPAS